MTVKLGWHTVMITLLVILVLVGSSVGFQLYKKNQMLANSVEQLQAKIDGLTKELTEQTALAMCLQNTLEGNSKFVSKQQTIIRTQDQELIQLRVRNNHLSNEVAQLTKIGD